MGEPITTTIAVAALASGAYSTYEQKQAADDQAAARAARFEQEKKAKQAERRIAQRRAKQQRRAQVREAQRKRSTIENVAAQTGTAESTGATAAGRISTQAASNFGFLQDISRLSGKANTFRREGEQAAQGFLDDAAGHAGRASLAQGASDIFGSASGQTLAAKADATIFDT